ncbi:hypothetical protein QAD02_007322 [Eretmocerus hayati]|uniref:Uncharacterized protein n=1 Tax=Eretmocerus hayati TaxID=131215 RepID=A0ACC2N3A7_9HYME|nr:hypothetical protein QAD02_007322 [Eretmocerus hayati]
MDKIMRINGISVESSANTFSRRKLLCGNGCGSKYEYLGEFVKQDIYLYDEKGMVRSESLEHDKTTDKIDHVMESARNETNGENLIDPVDDKNVDGIPRNLRDDVERFEVADLVRVDMGCSENCSAGRFVEQRETRCDEKNFRENSKKLNSWSTCDRCHAVFKMGDDENSFLFESSCEECKIEAHSELKKNIESEDNKE